MDLPRCWEQDPAPGPLTPSLLQDNPLPLLSLSLSLSELRVCLRRTAISQTDPPRPAAEPLLIRDQARRPGPAHSLPLAQPTHQLTTTELLSANRRARSP